MDAGDPRPRAGDRGHAGRLAAGSVDRLASQTPQADPRRRGRCAERGKSGDCQTGGREAAEPGARGRVLRRAGFRAALVDRHLNVDVALIALLVGGGHIRLAFLRGVRAGGGAIAVRRTVPR